MVEVTKDELERIVKDSHNFSDLCRKLGVKPKGGNYYTIKRLIAKFNLDISHFSKKPWNEGIKYRTNTNGIRSMDEVLQEGTSISSYALKKRLFNNGYKEKRCECCGNDTWLDKPIKLELHHINGNHFDNRLENLQILCPNCHSFTDTFRGKNQGRFPQENENNQPLCKPLTQEEIIERERIKRELKRKGSTRKKREEEIRKCLYCGKEFTTHNGSSKKYCSARCSAKHLSRKPEKEVLSKDIETIGYNLTQIGNKYGVSANSIKKWFKAYGLYKKFQYQAELGTRIGKYNLEGKKIEEYKSLSVLIKTTHHKFLLKKLKEKDGVIYEGFRYKVL